MFNSSDCSYFKTNRKKWRKAIASACLFTMLTILAAPSSAAIVLQFDFSEGTDGQIATGTDSILDSSGNGLHGTPVNGPIYRKMNDSMALQFDGTNRIFVADAPEFQISGSLSLEAMIRLDTYTNANRTKQLIFFRGDSRGGLDPFQLDIRADGRLRFIVTDSDNRSAAVSSPDVVPLNELLHVAGTLDDATGVMKLFINGELVDALNTDRRPFAMLDPDRNPGIGIGSRQDGGDDFFHGLIGNVRIHNSAIAIPEPGFGFPLALAVLGLGTLRGYRQNPYDRCSIRSSPTIDRSLAMKGSDRVR
jgi:hypothetical protein